MERVLSESVHWQVPPTVMFHTANAWEEGDEVRLYGCCMNVVRSPKIPCLAS